MIFAKEKNVWPLGGIRTIPYEVEEFIFGRVDYVTDCPYKEMGRYTMTINKVGDLGCNTCKWQVSHDRRECIVKCSHPKLEEDKVKKLFKY